MSIHVCRLKEEDQDRVKKEIYQRIAASRDQDTEVENINKKIIQWIDELTLSGIWEHSTPTSRLKEERENDKLETVDFTPFLMNCLFHQLPDLLAEGFIHSIRQSVSRLPICNF